MKKKEKVFLLVRLNSVYFESYLQEYFHIGSNLPLAPPVPFEFEY